MLRFVNTGTVTSNAPGFGIVAPPHATPVFVDKGAVQVGTKGVFAAAGVFDLASGGTISNHGIFDYAGTTLNLDGGTVTAGVLTNPYHLGAGPSTVVFGHPVPAGATGTIDVEIPTTLVGVIPKRWTINVTAGSVTAVGSGNDGTLDWGTSTELITTEPFVNASTLNDSSGTLEVVSPDFVNAATGHILANNADAGVMVTGNFSNYGRLLVGPNRVSVTKNYDQTATGSIELTVTGTYAFGFVSVDGRAILGGALAVAKLRSYTAAAGDSQQIVIAHGLSGIFRDVSVFEDGPGLLTKLNYSAGGVSIEVQKRT